MDLVSALLSALLFYAFVPGVFMTLPKGSSHKTVLVVHAVLFAVVSSMVMWYYWTKVKEYFGNHGASCPASHRMLPDETCQPIGGERGKVYGTDPKLK